MKSLGIKRSMMVADRRSSISLEKAFWKGLQGIAADRGLTVSALVDSIASSRHHANLSSVIRHYVLDYYRTKIAGGSQARDLDRERANKDGKASAQMPFVSVNSQYCQERASQARTLANRTSEPQARVAMLAVAEQYERLANRAELLKARAQRWAD
jgi:predicted DNA-binding ribbon-helix-helix protein